MTILEQMLMGKMEMAHFVYHLQTNIEIQQEINNLIPESAKFNPNHEIWKKYAYYSVKNVNFDLFRFLKKICRFDGSMGDNLNIHSTIMRFHRYHNPGFQYTLQYKERYDLYLEVSNDRFEGPEVNHILEKIILEACAYKTKKQRKEQAQKAIKEVFHIENNKYPRWIQGADWPMGQYSPMKFIDKKRKGECVYYTFLDVDSGATRTIEQFY